MQTHAGNKKAHSNWVPKPDDRGRTVTKNRQHKYLEVIIESHLNWSSHIKQQCSLARKIVALLYRRYYQHSNPNTLVKLYLTVVRPHLEYAAKFGILT